MGSRRDDPPLRALRSGTVYEPVTSSAPSPSVSAGDMMMSVQASIACGAPAPILSRRRSARGAAVRSLKQKGRRHVHWAHPRHHPHPLPARRVQRPASHGTDLEGQPSRCRDLKESQRNAAEKHGEMSVAARNV
jgi:hypothetical protein